MDIEELGLRPGEVRPLALGRANVFLVCGDSGLPEVVLDARCAHMGSQVRWTGNGFACPTHGWSYSREGTNFVRGNPGLEHVPFSIEGSELVVELPSRHPLLPPNGSLEGSEHIELLAHASFLLTAGRNRVLFDPWLQGPAYWGAWHHYPKNSVDVSELSVSHVVITHPHPDHFHLPTIDHLDRDVHFIIPNFESGILQKELRKRNFSRIHLLEWETEFWLGDDVGLAFLRPLSQWEDSSCLVRVRDWIWLNQNDSGSVLRDDLIPDQVNLLTSAFDVGASGWPLTWDMSESRKKKIVSASKRATLDAIKARCSQVKADFFAPFAGWWRLGLDVHREFADQLDHTTHSELHSILADTTTKLIPTIPSSVIRLKDMSHSWNPKVMKQLSEEPTEHIFSPPSRYIENDDLRREIERYMQDLTLLSEASNCEPVIFNLHIPDAEFTGKFRFGDPGLPEVTEISVEAPGWVAEKLVSNDSTAIWNHFDIGYWGRWCRSPDVYPANFMRLLQLGSPRALFSRDYGEECSEIGLMSIADFLEKEPELAQAILGRAGLPCFACGKANADTLEDAMRLHGVRGNMRQRLEVELRALMNTEL